MRLYRHIGREGVGPRFELGAHACTEQRRHPIGVPDFDNPIFDGGFGHFPEPDEECLSWSVKTIARIAVFRICFIESLHTEKI